MEALIADSIAVWTCVQASRTGFGLLWAIKILATTSLASALVMCNPLLSAFPLASSPVFESKKS